MIIDLNKLNVKDEISINEKILFPKEIYENSQIVELKEVNVNGKIKYNYSDEIELDLSVSGDMILLDSITLDEIVYPYSFSINEIVSENNLEIKQYYKNNKNTLDIIPILWQNIVLEVPISITNENNPNYSGDGWRLISDDEKENDPRLAVLNQLLDD